MGCNTGLIENLSKEYGHEKIVQYFLAQKRNAIVSKQFKEVRKKVADKFNQKIRFNIENVAVFDSVLKKVLDEEENYMKTQKEPPKIIELDELKMHRSAEFEEIMEGAEKEFKRKLQGEEKRVMRQIKGKLNYNDYLKDSGFDQLL